MSASRTHGRNLSSDEEDRVDELKDDPPFIATRERAVELSDPWSGPQTYAEDFYSGGDIRDDPSRLSPSWLTPGGTSQDEDGVGMVLTPGVVSITPSPVASPHAVRDAEDADDVDERVDEVAEHPTSLNWTSHAEGASHSVPTFSMPAFQEDESQPSSSQRSSQGYGDVHNSPAAEALNVPSGSACVQCYEHLASPPLVPTSGHPDWSHLPASPGARPASASGHLEFPLRPVYMPPIRHASSPEILEISDDDDDVPDAFQAKVGPVEDVVLQSAETRGGGDEVNVFPGPSAVSRGTFSSPIRL